LANDCFDDVDHHQKIDCAKKTILVVRTDLAVAVAHLIHHIKALP
jgi:hypothetical protein